MDREVSKLKTWELYVGFVFVQILVGIIVTLLISVFDLVGIRGALSQVVRQLGVVMNAQPMQKYVSPIAGELKEGKYI
jgi:uncharacterized phage infection (PIP) family protein YhgE